MQRHQHRGYDRPREVIANSRSPAENPRARRRLVADDRTRAEERYRHEEERREKDSRGMDCSGRSLFRRRRRRGRIGTLDLCGGRRRRCVSAAHPRAAEKPSGAPASFVRSGLRAPRARPSCSAPGASGRVRNPPARRLPAILVVRLGTFELMLRRRVADFIALIAEIESQIFAGIGFLIPVAEGAIERIVGFWFITRFLFSIFGLSGRSGCGGAAARAVLVLESLRTRFRSLHASLRLGAIGCRGSATGSRLTMPLSTGDLSALARGRAARIVRGACDSFSGFCGLAGSGGAGLRTLAAPGPR